MNDEWLQQMDALGITIMERAFACGHPAIVEMLLRQERHEQDVEEENDSPLHRSVRLGLTSAVKALLEFGFDSATMNRQRETALHKAVRCGHLKIVELLVDVCDTNGSSEEGMTPLHWASVTGNAAIAKLLVRHDADPHVRNEIVDGLTPAEMASVMGHVDMEDVFETCDTFY